MLNRKSLADALRGQAKTDKSEKPININITLDMSSLAGALKQQQPEYQKIDGFSPNVSG